MTPHWFGKKPSKRAGLIGTPAATGTKFMEIKSCAKCGTGYTKESWVTLEDKGTVDYGDGPLNFRNCPCGSTLAIEEN